MKNKLFTTILVCILSVFLLSSTARGDDKGSIYYPKSNEMKTNLENSGYNVDVTTELGDKNGTYLSATKENKYIYLYWLDNVEDCEYYYNLLEDNYVDYNSLVQIKNDEKLVYCRTENAINTVEIKVKDHHWLVCKQLSGGLIFV